MSSPQPCVPPVPAGFPGVRNSRSSELFALHAQSRLGALMGAPSDYIDSLPAEVKRRLRALKNLQTQHGELEAQFREEQLKLERKFHDLYTPLYTKRNAIIGGTVEPTDEECEREVSDVEDGVEAASIQELDSNNAPKTVKGPFDRLCVRRGPLFGLLNRSGTTAWTTGVPEFWATVLKTHPVVAKFITPEDEPALAYLADVRLRYNEDNLVRGSKPCRRARPALIASTKGFVGSM